MKMFFLKIGFFFIGVLLFLYLLFLKADGYTDSFYLRFTSPKQSSLIIGTSRAAQGINPSVLNAVLDRNDIYNYSFTVSHSPYGDTYLNSIKSKLDTSSKESIFIMTIDPWSISSITSDPNDYKNFRELSLCLNNVNNVCMNPNIEYLLTSYNKPYIELFSRNSQIFLKDNGWLKVNVDMSEESVNFRLKRKIDFYQKDMLPFYRYSTKRFKIFKTTISYLQKYGTVYIVRLPIHQSILEIENVLMHDFENRMDELVIEMNLDYIDYTKTNTAFKYTDGNHLFEDSANELSSYIGEWIKSLKKKSSNKDRNG